MTDTAFDATLTCVSGNGSGSMAATGSAGTYQGTLVQLSARIDHGGAQPAVKLGARYSVMRSDRCRIHSIVKLPRK